ncbi:Xaa-Pro peptidase family protein [Thermoflexus sp.]|uniref:Xaa-Pro peptidase family protein n=1 Tax=Thermoflexus sp. TaxID=1969742 RepID=UPI00299A55B4|nr:Xaa-Pro peptidase family protein [Thermoflexus sp.]MDW8065234.1 Xaa-Pro peptidase family protein [Anaerolineae bacterium]
MIDAARRERLLGLMREEGYDVLICRLPEHVVYLTNYWPHHGFSVALITRDGYVGLLVPEIELEYADSEWAEVIPFGWGLLKDPDLYTSYREHLSKLRDRLGLHRAIVGIERSAEVVAPTYRHAEPVVPAAPWHDLLGEVFPEATLRGVDDLLARSRAVKTPYEIERIRLANEVAALGLARLKELALPGRTEAQVGAAIEAEIRARGTGYRGARLVRASAEVSAGPEGSYKGYLLVPSTSRVIQEGDLVMVELATVVDGYWSDLTRVVVAGEPHPRQREVYELVRQAQQAAIQAMRPGVPAEAVDWAARKVIEEAGYGAYFNHITGHGVGYRYHEFIPFLAPGVQTALEVGMVCTVEPGVYIPGFGGIRIEDDVTVTSEGPQVLSTADRML